MPLSRVALPLVGASDPPAAQESDSVFEKAVDWLLGTPLHIVVIIVVALLVMAVLRRTIRGVTEHIAKGTSVLDSGLLADTEFGAVLRDVSPLASSRRTQRARTIGTVLRSVSTLVIMSIAILLILDLLRVNIAPFLASAGIAGVALGFGAQSLVKDFLSGIFLLIEDQYGIGDTVQVGEVVGTVESVALRITEVRDVDGTLWYIRNGEILRVGNRTQGWARASVEVRLPYDSDLATAHTALQEAADALAADESVTQWLQTTPEISGIETLNSTTLTLRVSARAEPPHVADVSRVLRTSVRESIERHGIVLAPDPATTMIIRPEAAESKATPSQPPSRPEK